MPVGAVDARRDGDGARRHVVRDARGEVELLAHGRLRHEALLRDRRRRASFSGAHVSFVGDLTGNAFDCPLPPGAAELCNATCVGRAEPTLRHVVLGRWTDDATDAAIAAVLACLRALPPRVPEILSYDVGADENITAGNFDFGVVGTFASKATFEAYEASAPHQACLALLAPVLAEKAAVEQAL